MQNEHTIVTAIIELPRFYFMEQRKGRMKHNYCQKFSFDSKILPLIYRISLNRGFILLQQIKINEEIVPLFVFIVLTLNK